MRTGSNNTLAFGCHNLDFVAIFQLPDFTKFESHSTQIRKFTFLDTLRYEILHHVALQSVQHMHPFLPI